MQTFIYLIGATISLIYCSLSNTSPSNSFFIKELSKPITVENIASIRQEKWFKDLGAYPSYAVCFTIKDEKYFKPTVNDEPKQIYGCIFSNQQFMNWALLRPGIFTHTPLGLVNSEQLLQSPLMKSIGGHDFNSENLSKYAKALPFPKSEKVSEETKTLEMAEQKFWQDIITPKLSSGKFYFFAIVDRWSFVENLSHELLHGQFYYYESQIKPQLAHLWNQMGKEDQELMIKTLKKAGYDTNQQDLLLREVLSYFVQSNAHEFTSVVQALRPLANLVPKYQQRLKTDVENIGIKLIDLPAPFTPPAKDIVT